MVTSLSLLGLRSRGHHQAAKVSGTASSSGISALRRARCSAVCCMPCFNGGPSETVGTVSGQTPRWPGDLLRALVRLQMETKNFASARLAIMGDQGMMP